ncbi:hypothetical protein CsatB_022584 [Cannabis sativa]|uniref:SAM domain-containing protein n=2 Tax=Cannabis sativa TaxID=3483 RepID=A0AB40EAV2_CANSA|nr:uncharacterized protein LOC115714954 [Cannabis sativa]KAF4404760.1 hypothetical protein G4B88_006146 [Cannabis sativa]
MADDFNPFQPPITAASTATIPPPTTATPPPQLTAPPSSFDNPGPSLAPKRQRRPSVRLGEIGDQPAATLSYDSHVRRAKHPWRFSRDSSAVAATSKSVKARSLTNLVNGGDSQEIAEAEDRNQNGDALNFELGIRRVKSKRATAVKRVRSNWVSNSNSKQLDDGADSREELGEEGFRDFDPELDSPMREQSPVQSLDNAGVDTWNDSLPEASCGGVRSWLIELGLSRYAPVFEIHEVDDDVLPMLTLEDLKDMGINAVGSRRKMYSAIQKLGKGFS